MISRVTRPGRRRRLRAGIDAEGLKETADVVPDRLGAQVELGGDLLRRAALLQKTKHLDLAGVRCGRGAVGVSSGRSSISPKTPTTRSPFMSGTELTSTGTRVPAVETRSPVASVATECRASSGKPLAGARPVLGCDDGGEVATANVADKPLGCRIEPADESRFVEDVAGTPTLSRACSRSPPTPRPAAITEVWLIRAAITERACEWQALCEWFRVLVQVSAAGLELHGGRGLALRELTARPFASSSSVNVPVPTLVAWVTATFSES